jgi:hypothetical protein
MKSKNNEIKKRQKAKKNAQYTEKVDAIACSISSHQFLQIVFSNF